MGKEQRWCILRTSGGRTLKLARSLSAAGFAVWTPTETVKRRRARSKEEIEIERPIVPTFVFAGEEHLADLVHVLALPLSPHPQFSIFQYAGRVPIVGDHSLSLLRMAEHDAEQKLRKKKRHDFAIGSVVRVQDEPAWQGMSGVVESNDGKRAWVSFGGPIAVEIAAWKLLAHEIQAALEPA